MSERTPEITFLTLRYTDNACADRDYMSDRVGFIYTHACEKPRGELLKYERGS